MQKLEKITMKYHLNPETGNPGVCIATLRVCKYGGENKHYESKEIARQEYEKQMIRSEISPSSKSGSKNLNDASYDILFPEESNRRGEVSSLAKDLKRNKNRSIRCPECNRKVGDASVALMLEESGTQITCKRCDTIIATYVSPEVTFPIVELNQDSPTYAAVNADNVPKMIWYHWTTSKDWETSINSSTGPDRVHLGGEIAAADRSNSSPGYLYAVEILEDSSIDEDIHEESTYDFTADPENNAAVVRYANVFEDSGSISLAAKPRSIRVLGYRNFSFKTGQALTTYFPNDNMDEYIEKKYPDGKA